MRQTMQEFLAGEVDDGDDVLDRVGELLPVRPERTEQRAHASRFPCRGRLVAVAVLHEGGDAG
jgi:hypothetical protein